MATVEAILLIFLYAFILFPALIKSDYSPINIFKTSGAFLGARIERDMTIGRDFKNRNGEPVRWEEPPR